MKHNWKGPIFLLLCAFFWGMAFTAQSSAMDHMEPYTFVFLRSVLTCGTLCAAMPLFRRMDGTSADQEAPLSRHLIIGAACGCILVLASGLQQQGLVTTTTAKSGFITALYIVIVPLLGIFLGKRPRAVVGTGVCVSLAGLYFLCMKDGELNINSGDLFTLGSALVFAVHILVIDRFGGSLNSAKLSAVQFGTAAIIAGIIAFAFETPTLSGILACWKAIAYAGIFSGALGYTFQIVGQKSTDPTLASLIMCLESVFAALGGWIILGQTLSPRELLGCALMLSASMIAQLPERKKSLNAQKSPDA